MSQEPKQYKVLISTDPGKVRALNEDNFVLNKTVRRAESPFQHVRARSLREPLLCGVFDGMGGEKGGKAASEIAARVALKFYEYLATGKPVVSTLVPLQVLDYADCIYLAETPAEFVTRCREALAETPDSPKREARIEAARRNSWDEKVGEMKEILGW